VSGPLRIAVLGAGSRGREAYGRWMLEHPERTQVVAVVDTRIARAQAFAVAAGAQTRVYGRWQDLVADLGDLRLDAAVVALPDHEHVEPAIALADAGVAMLLEKPAAPTASELERLADNCARTGARVAVGHVLRFTPFWRTIKEIIDSPGFGRVLTIDLRENVGFWHFAHSYVRGNWSEARTSSPFALAKTCHDFDLIRWMAGEAPRTVFSVGELSFFRPENAPAGAPAFCIEGCPAERDCAFYAPRYYLDALRDVHGVPVALLTDDTSVDGRRKALHTSDYGRCVFRSTNDAVDHQQTTMSFRSGLVATLTASAFTGRNTRDVSISGTNGQVTGNMETGRLEVDLFSPTSTLPPLSFATVEATTVRPPMQHQAWTLTAKLPGRDAGDHRGHAGGDDGLMEGFVEALENGTLGADPQLSLAAAVDSHRMAFAAEESRLAGESIELAPRSHPIPT